MKKRHVGGTIETNEASPLSQVNFQVPLLLYILLMFIYLFVSSSLCGRGRVRGGAALLCGRLKRKGQIIVEE